MDNHANTGKELGFVDLPAAEDALGLDRYFTGLARFMENCPTPMTIAIQGGWGSGKTSAMRIIRQKLDEKASRSGKKLLQMEFNTWQYARAAKGTLFLPLLLRLIRTIDDQVDEDHKEAYGKRFSQQDNAAYRFAKYFAGSIMMAGKGVIEKIPGIGDTAGKALEQTMQQDSASDSEARSFDYVVEMKKQLDEKIRFLVDESGVDRLVFYIDDLDRLGPEEAVEFLEDIKNYIECEHCVFVLALDHEIVRRGLKKKYGDEIRDAYAEHFFDKIIQMPFNLPCNRYDIGQYLRGLLGDDPDTAAFARIISGFGDTNPRTIKRVFNIMSMYESIDGQPYQGHRGCLLSLLLLQTNHEELYGKLMEAIREDQEADPDLNIRLLFGDPDARLTQIDAWLDAPRNHADRLAAGAVAEAFSLDRDRSPGDYELLLSIAGATSITGTHLGGAPQTIAKTKQAIRDYAQYLGLVPCASGTEDVYVRADGTGPSVTIREISRTHVNLNLFGVDELTKKTDEQARSFFVNRLRPDEPFAVRGSYTERGKSDGMDIIYGLKGSCCLRNISVAQRASMRLAGRVLRSIARCGCMLADE